MFPSITHVVVRLIGIVSEGYICNTSGARIILLYCAIPCSGPAIFTIVIFTIVDHLITRLSSRCITHDEI
ncbi:hypothetical protein HOLleu_30320 [Holothuria leucospilota]|uniref:Uncharacterized protein n=1 Tax=Holothuria leucospilota TaxID=206669 RepID=A0A9Q1BKI5_HOLLE|nr:hypothetical protein HOLleu_30320 [Holothuria leucospilota]